MTVNAGFEPSGFSTSFILNTVLVNIWVIIFFFEKQTDAPLQAVRQRLLALSKQIFNILFMSEFVDTDHRASALRIKDGAPSVAWRTVGLFVFFVGSADCRHLRRSGGRYTLMARVADKYGYFIRARPHQS